jgi:enoyl-CoA hydratase/carnithine racemase
MTVTSEKNGPVTTVILSRAHARNAVDPETAAALVAAFEAFEADDEARVGVFFGDHGAFCAGAESDRQSAYEQWDLPLGEALMNELRLGYATLESGETAAGVSWFTSGRRAARPILSSGYRTSQLVAEGCSVSAV